MYKNFRVPPWGSPFLYIFFMLEHRQFSLGFISPVLLFELIGYEFSLQVM